MFSNILEINSVTQATSANTLAQPKILSPTAEFSTDKYISYAAPQQPQKQIWISQFLTYRFSYSPNDETLNWSKEKASAVEKWNVP